MKSYLTLSFVGALQGIFLAVYFFQKSKAQKAFLYLSLYVFVFSVGLLEDWINDNASVTILKIIGILISTSSYLYGPFLYLFVYNIIRRSDPRPKLIYHFLPFLLTLSINLIILFFGIPISEDLSGVTELIFFELLVIQILSYNIKAIKLLNNYRNNVLQYSDVLVGKELDWLRALMTIITSIYILSFVMSHLLLFGVKIINDFFIVIQLSITGSIYFMSYMVLFKPGTFELILTEKNNNGIINEMDSSRSKYKRSGLKEDKAKQHLKELTYLMSTQKLFRNPDLNISVLSEKLGISKSHLTQVINEQVGMSFFEFINMYRTEEAKQLLLDPGFSHLTIAGIAKEVGYKSKTTFFINFKKITSFSPLEWLKKEKQQSNRVQS